MFCVWQHLNVLCASSMKLTIFCAVILVYSCFQFYSEHGLCSIVDYFLLWDSQYTVHVCMHVDVCLTVICRFYNVE